MYVIYLKNCMRSQKQYNGKSDWPFYFRQNYDKQLIIILVIMSRC